MSKKVEFRAGDEGFVITDVDDEEIRIKIGEMGDLGDVSHSKVEQGETFQLILRRVLPRDGPFIYHPIEGRVSNRRGVLPMSLVDPHTLDAGDFVPQIADSSFMKEIYFRISAIDYLTDTNKYLARFYVRKNDTNQDEEKEYGNQPDYNNLPPVRYHARGLVSRHQMDVLDGLKFTQSVKPSVSVWRSENSDRTINPPHTGLNLTSTVNSQFQSDCLEGLFKTIFYAAEKCGLTREQHIKGNNSSGSTPRQLEQTIPNKGDVVNEVTLGQKTQKRCAKKSLKKRLGSVLRSIIGCVRRQGGGIE